MVFGCSDFHSGNPAEIQHTSNIGRQPEFGAFHSMLTKQSRALQAFRRVEVWFADHPAVIPASGTSAQALTNQVAALSGVITRMTAQGTDQTTQKGQATLAAKDEVALRTDLRKVHMRAITKVARALRGQVPGVGVIKMPPPALNSDALVKAAEALYSTSSVYKDVFAEHGLPTDFLDQLAAASSALKASVDARGLALSKRTGATSGVAGEYSLGRKILTMIDASLTHALKNDAATLASWRQVMRVTVKGTTGGSNTATAPTGSAAVATPSTAPIALVGQSGAPSAASAALSAASAAPSAASAEASVVPVSHIGGSTSPMPETAAA
jgi:hypothetical protein